MALNTTINAKAKCNGKRTSSIDAKRRQDKIHAFVPEALETRDDDAGTG